MNAQVAQSIVETLIVNEYNYWSEKVLWLKLGNRVVVESEVFIIK